MTVRTLQNPDELTEIQVFDTRRQWGVALSMTVPIASEVGLAQPSEPVLLRPRFCRVTKSELATIRHRRGRSSDARLGRRGVGGRSVVRVRPPRGPRAGGGQLAGDVGGLPVDDSPADRRRDGTVLWIETTNLNALHEEPPHVVSELVDITEEMAAHEASARNEDFLRRLTSALPVGVSATSANGPGCVTSWSGKRRSTS